MSEATQKGFTYTGKKIITTFNDEEHSRAEEKFTRYMGVDCTWFVDLLYAIKKEWIDNDFKVSDIIIRENHPVFISFNKASIPFAQLVEGKKQHIVVEQDKLKNVVKLLNLNTDKNPNTDIIDFSFSVMGLGIYRGNYSKDSSGAGLILRYLPFDTLPLEAIGYPSFYIKEIKSLIGETPVATPFGTDVSSIVSKSGLIVHVGPTGSGKTTAMSSEVGFLAEAATGLITTYENPIEIKHILTKAMVRQYEIGVDITEDEGTTIANKILLHAMRNNPSVIVYGESRTKEDIRIAVEVSMRGHLTLTTMHASNVKEALSTISGAMKGEEYIVANAIRAIVAHKLITTKKGTTLPILEIFIPNEQDRVNIAEGDINAVVRSFEGEDIKHDTAITYKKYIAELVSKGKLDMNEAMELERTLFLNPNKKGS